MAETHSNSPKTQLSAQMNNCSLRSSTASPSPVPSVSSVTAFVLRLPDHQKELHRFVWDLFDEGLHTDVTIALDDGQYIRAHKLILCAFSTYFRQVLNRLSNPYQYPVIVVKDMHYDDVRSLIEYMYRGSITVPNHRLTRVLNCAKQLKIRGLFDTTEEISDESHECNYTNNEFRIVSQNIETIEPKERKDFSYLEPKIERKQSVISERSAYNYSVNQEFVSNWLNKKSIPIPSPPKFPPTPTPALTPMQQKIALDLTKRFPNPPKHQLPNSEHLLPNNYFQSPNALHPGFTSHPSLFRSTSVDERQLNKNKIALNDLNGKVKRAPSSLDGHLDDNNNDLEPNEHRKEKKRNLNIFHAAKYRNRKKQQLEELFVEENELQKKSCLHRVQIEKLENTILGLIWSQTKKSINSQTVFSCPVCGCAQTEVQKLRSHINMLHNDTEALMKFLMLQRSPTLPNSTNSPLNPIPMNPNGTNIIQMSNSAAPVPFCVNAHH